MQAKETSGLFGDVRVKKDETLALTMTLINHAGQNRTCPEEVCVVVMISSFRTPWRARGTGPASVAASHPLGNPWMMDSCHPWLSRCFPCAASAADVGVA